MKILSKTLILAAAVAAVSMTAVAADAVGSVPQFQRGVAVCIGNGWVLGVNEKVQKLAHRGCFRGVVLGVPGDSVLYVSKDDKSTAPGQPRMAPGVYVNSVPAQVLPALKLPWSIVYNLGAGSYLVLRVDEADQEPLTLSAKYLVVPK